MSIMNAIEKKKKNEQPTVDYTTLTVSRKSLTQWADLQEQQASLLNPELLTCNMSEECNHSFLGRSD